MAQDYPARALLDAQGEILERMAEGLPLRETLIDVAKLVERLAPPALCSVVLVQPDGKHLRPVAAPSLPEAYCAAIDGIEIGPCCGSCGTAAWRKEPVIVTDIATDPLWEAPREFTLSFGLRACWSQPILQDDGTVLGTIALYYREPRGPTEHDFGLLAPCAKLIRLALAFDRKEHLLLTSEARWRSGVELLGLGAFDLNLATGEDKWSSAMRRILGVPKDAPSTFETFLERVHPDDRAGVRARFPDPHTPRSGTWREEIRILRGDTGEERNLISQGCVIPAREGSAAHSVGIITDVTEQRRHENELRQEKIQAEAANRAKSQFLASMSHELRTPLNAIIGFSDLIRAGVYGQIMPERYAGYIDDIFKSGTHLLSLINDVLDMAKIEAQKFELHRTWVPLAGLAESALVMVRLQAQVKGIMLKAEIDGDLSIHADERAMRQVLVNLLSNAVKFTGVTGVVRLFATPLADGSLSLGVDDTGSGMDENGIAAALEPFGQVAMDVTAERTGTGLGLPIAKALMEYHGATFGITSALGVGTRVWADFPASDVSTHSDKSARG